jgi:16S rRNA processing protein RimM
LADEYNSLQPDSIDDSQQDEKEGSVGETAEPGFLAIGRVIRPHGVRGDVTVDVYTHMPERFSWLEQIYVSRNVKAADPDVVDVEGVRFHQGRVLLKLSGYDTREDAEGLRGIFLFVPEDEGIPLEENEVFLFDLEGLDVYTDEDEYLGVLVEVLETGANDVFIVKGDGGELLIPNTEEAIVEVDLEAKRMVVHILPGLLP